MGYLGNMKFFGLENQIKKSGEWLGDRWDDVTGKTAAEKATEAQQEGTESAIESQERMTREAIEAQIEAQERAMAAQQKMFEEAMVAQQSYQQQQQDLLSPFYERADQSMGQMGVLAGLEGAGAQQQAIDRLQNSPMFQAQLEQQENALLQNAAATGGIRGGNAQGALAQFRPGMLRNEIQQQMANLGGITSAGANPLSQAASGLLATGQGQANMYGQQGQSLANMFGQQGQTQAGLLSNLGANVGGLQQQLGQMQGSNILAQHQMGQNFFFDAAGLGLKIGGLF